MFPIGTLTDMDLISQNIEITMILISPYYFQFNHCFQSLLLESLFVFWNSAEYSISTACHNFPLNH